MDRKALKVLTMTQLCRCGCGRPTSLAKYTYKERGWVKGEPIAFIHGHNRRQRENYDVVASGCWMFRGAQPGSYGKVTLDDGSQELAHRYYYIEFKGPIPLGCLIDHVCRQPACVNPEHLEAVIPAENVRRGDATPLTHEQVAEIRASKELQRVVASIYGVNQSTISRIRNGRTWA